MVALFIAMGKIRTKKNGAGMGGKEGELFYSFFFMLNLRFPLTHPSSKDVKKLV